MTSHADAASGQKSLKETAKNLYESADHILRYTDELQTLFDTPRLNDQAKAEGVYEKSGHLASNYLAEVRAKATPVRALGDIRNLLQNLAQSLDKKTPEGEALKDALDDGFQEFKSAVMNCRSLLEKEGKWKDAETYLNDIKGAIGNFVESANQIIAIQASKALPNQRG